MNTVSGYADLSRASGQALPTRPAYAVEVGIDAEAFVARWDRLAGRNPMPFHKPEWLRAWIAAFGSQPGVRPVLTAVRSAASNADLMLLPLVARRRAGLSTLSLADASVVDYQLPLLAAEWTEGQAPEIAAGQLWGALRGALGAHDVLRIEKMLPRLLDPSPADINPLALTLRTRECAMHGNQIEIGEDYDAWRHTLDKRVRKELERCWRVFTRSATARFERVTDPAVARRVFDELEAQQSQRMTQTGKRYLLDDAAYRRFYRETLRTGLADGSVVLTCLLDGEAVVAALYGVANRDRFIALRLSTGGEAWAPCSPGRLLLERTARHLHETGLRRFDFGIGEYAHKATFNVKRIALLDAMEALSWRGRLVVWGWRMRCALKRHGWLVALVRKLQGTTGRAPGGRNGA